MMQDWQLIENGYRKEDVPALGNRLLIGNGFLGVRGTVDESEAEDMPAINLAGIYDKVGDGWREPINAPNPCFAYLSVDGEKKSLTDSDLDCHRQELDYRHGIYRRITTWKSSRGSITFTSERFADYRNVNLIGICYKISADYHASVELYTGIDGRVWDLNGPHLENMSFEDADGVFHVSALTHENGVQIHVSDVVKNDFPSENTILQENDKILHKISFVTIPGDDYEIEKIAYVGFSEGQDNLKETAEDALKKPIQDGYHRLLLNHKDEWEKLWSHSEVDIKGDEAAMKALNYSLYHLQSIAPHHTKSLSIPARGLSGQTYKGAVFWDTEMFMLDFFLFTDPATARALMKYRINTLDGARKKAASYGYEGAFYAWESQEGGFDACSDYNVTDVFTGRPMRTFFKDKQMHISAAVVYGILRYAQWTGDDSILDEDGVRTIIECARFYYDLLIKHLDRDYYEIPDVIGPDEYHERVNNNAYTNRMAKYVLESAVNVIADALKRDCVPDGYDEKDLSVRFQDAVDKIYIPQPETSGEHKGVIPQFDGYFELEDATLSEVRSRLLNEKEYWGGAYGVASHTQIIKQADVITMLQLFSDEYSEDIIRRNWDFYEPRTEHGSSLSAGMYAMSACGIKEADRAYPFFIKSANADLVSGGKEWAGLVYIGGTHPAAAGAAYMTAIKGFGGIKIKDGKLVSEPCLPKSIEEMTFKIIYKGDEYEVHADHSGGTVKRVS